MPWAVRNGERPLSQPVAWQRANYFVDALYNIVNILVVKAGLKTMTDAMQGRSHSTSRYVWQIGTAH